MKRCIICGKSASSSNDKYCEHCGGELETTIGFHHKYCSNCGEQITEDNNFCGKCGTKTFDEAPANVYTPQKKKSDPTMVILVALLLTLVITMAVTMMIVISRSGKKAETTLTSDAPTVTQSSSEKKEEADSKEEQTETQDKEQTETQDEEEAEEAPPVEKKEPVLVADNTPVAQPQKIVVTKRELEVTIDNYVQSYVNAMNTGDSTYMLPYVIPGCSLYNTQKNFIKNAYYEEYIDSYIIGDIKVEDNNTCVVSVYEIYNVAKPGQSLKRTEQTATYRIKRDSDGIWKMHSFVGTVKTHS